MKKLLKKKITIFEREVSVVLIALIGVGLVSAALLPYISNVIIANFVVAQPLDLEISNDGSLWGDGPLLLGNKVGGSNINFFVKVDTNGDEPIDVLIVTEINNSINDATCTDFSFLEIYTPTAIHTGGGDLGPGWVNVLPFCITSGGKATITIPAEYNKVLGDTPQTYEVNGTLALNIAPATYDINVRAEMRP